MNLSEDLQYVIELARSAGALVLEHYGKVDRLLKRNDEAVTEADRASQRLIVTGLRKRFPGDGVIGEENETGDAITFDVSNPAGRNWVIDPIDGTNNFIAGTGHFRGVHRTAGSRQTRARRGVRCHARSSLRRRSRPGRRGWERSGSAL